MTSITRGAFKFIRCCGAAEYQPVRQHLLQFATFSDDSSLDIQFCGIHSACAQLGLRMRVHINAERLKNEQPRMLDKIDFEILGNWRNDDTDIIYHDCCNREQFDNFMKNSVDVLVVRANDKPVMQNDITMGILELMAKYPRPLTGKDYHSALTHQILLQTYPQFYPDLDKHWTDFNKVN